MKTEVLFAYKLCQLINNYPLFRRDCCISVQGVPKKGLPWRCGYGIYRTIQKQIISSRPREASNPNTGTFFIFLWRGLEFGPLIGAHFFSPERQRNEYIVFVEWYLTGEYQSIWRTSYVPNTVTAPNPRRNSLDDKPRLHDEMSETNRIILATAPLYTSQAVLTFWRRNYFLILAHPVYKMWIIQEPNTLELWNKMHFEEKKTESVYHV